MRLFIYDATVLFKSGNSVRFHAHEVPFKWNGTQITSIAWPGAKGIGHIDPGQVEAITGRRILNWRRAFRG